MTTENSTSYAFTTHEIQSGVDRVAYAEGLILQLPAEHDGRNTWLLNYGRSAVAEGKRQKQGLIFDLKFQAVNGSGGPLPTFEALTRSENFWRTPRPVSPPESPSAFRQAVYDIATKTLGLSVRAGAEHAPLGLLELIRERIEAMQEDARVIDEEVQMTAELVTGAARNRTGFLPPVSATRTDLADIRAEFPPKESRQAVAALTAERDELRKLVKQITDDWDAARDSMNAICASETVELVALRALVHHYTGA